MKFLRKFLGKVTGQNSLVRDEIIKMISELEEERTKYRPDSIRDRRITEKTGLLVELAERLDIRL